jgi:hypothetical protein
MIGEKQKIKIEKLINLFEDYNSLNQLDIRNIELVTDCEYLKNFPAIGDEEIELNEFAGLSVFCILKDMYINYKGEKNGSTSGTQTTS